MESGDGLPAYRYRVYGVPEGLDQELLLIQEHLFQEIQFLHDLYQDKQQNNHHFAVSCTGGEYFHTT